MKSYSISAAELVTLTRCQMLRRLGIDPLDFQLTDPDSVETNVVLDAAAVAAAEVRA